MSSYPVLNDKPIDQWKVTELKEELKRRGLTTKGLKDDLIRRLDESLQMETEIGSTGAGKGLVSHPEPVVQYQDVVTMPRVDEKPSIIFNESDKDTELNNAVAQRRLDESLQMETEIGSTGAGKGLASHPEPVVQYQDVATMPQVDEKSSIIFNESGKDTELNNAVARCIVDVSMGLIVQEQVIERDVNSPEPVIVAETTVESSVQEITSGTSVQETTVETSRELTMQGFSPVVSESLAVKLNTSGQELQNNGAQNKSEALDIHMQNENLNPLHELAKLDSSDLEAQVYEVNNAKSDSISTDNVSVYEKIEELNVQPQREDSNPHHEAANLNSLAPETQVFEVSKVTSDSISTDNVSINEKTGLKDNIIADDVKLEFDVKHDGEEPSSGHVDLDDGNLQPVDVKEPQENDVKVEETETNADNPNIAKENGSGDVEFSKKLNIDQIEDDLLESKQIESKSLSVEPGDKIERKEVTVVREDFPVDAMVDDTNTGGKIEQKNVSCIASIKRRPHDETSVGNFETTKRQRRWNNEGLKVLETNNDNVSPSLTPRGTFQSNAKRNFSRSDSMAGVETPKERVVPPSSKPATSALRIDRFLRPFTLKAVQELLGKTGTVTNFWMDHIKTHCYVSFSSIEEAIETRNAVYNLQWPANGGRLLIAEFVEPQEVQMRIEAPHSPAAPVNTGPILPAIPAPMQSQPYPRVQVQRQAPRPPPAVPPPPPPPVSYPSAAREQALPPPPPLPERVTLPDKVDPPIVTLDDLFRKTKAIPRIYYLPLSDEQVKAKENANGKPPSSLQVLLEEGTL